MFYSSRLSIVAALSLLGFSACEKEHPTVYEKPITSVFLVLTPEQAGRRVVLSHIDNDGLGGLDPVVSDGRLNANATYSAELFIQQSASMKSSGVKHLIDTTTVMGQPELHQVFYLPLDGLNVQSAYNDLDDNGNPIGFKTMIKTGDISSGELKLIVIHAPDKRGDNVHLGQLDNASGQIDFETSFHLIVETAK